MKIVELILDEDQDASGIEAISIVENPAIEEDFIALKSDEIKLAEVSKEKKILMGALLIPNKPIYRKNGEDEYYIYFSKDTVLKASQMYLTKGNQNNSTLEHQHELSGLSLVESWLVEDEVHDKSRKYGMNLPLGTWMGAVKVNNDKIWNEYVKTGKVKGFSIEGYFADKMERPKESIKEDMSEQNADLLLSQIEKIVKGEKIELALDIRDIKQRAANSESVYKQSINASNKAIQRVANNIKQDVNIIEFNEKEVLKGFSELKSKAKELGIDINKTKIGSAIEQSLKIIEKSKKQTIALINKIKKINI
jgi:hypothetical protein